MSRPLTDEQLSHLAQQGWSKVGETIQKTFSFDGSDGKSPFLKGLAFIERVATLAEDANHHPDITFTYNRVVISLTTHDKGMLTEKDFDLATKIGAVNAMVQVFCDKIHSDFSSEIVCESPSGIPTRVVTHQPSPHNYNFQIPSGKSVYKISASESEQALETLANGFTGNGAAVLLERTATEYVVELNSTPEGIRPEVSVTFNPSSS
ncbi:MAG: 4a-hydroxytetrahydrobiopterin dehydratase [Chloroherpetonaceae bacterium]